MKRLLIALAFAAGIAGDAARAADHRDGPAVQADPGTDINDVYAWMSADGMKVNLVMTVFPNATTTSKFSTSALYTFHVNAFKAYGDMTPNTFTLVCSFDAAQKIQCWGPEGSNDYATGDASATAGVTSTQGKMKIFAGLRDDGFFFNVGGFRAAITAAAQALMMDPGACPTAAAAAAPALVTLLQSNGMSGAAQDGFRKGGDAVANYSGNVLALVVVLDKSTVTDATHPIVGVWGSTNMTK